MKKLLSFLCLLLALSTGGCADAPAGHPPLCGGYSPAAPGPEVKAAAAFAVGAEAKASGRALKLVEVVKAEQQVVAGVNYRLDLEVREGKNLLNAQAVVWSKLDGSRELTSWHWAGK